MRKKITIALAAACCLMAFSVIASAQKSRAAVPASEVNGTFSHRFGGKFKDSSSDIKIWALGNHKLKISMDLIYPHLMGNGELTANMGQLDGEATIDADTAVLRSTEFGSCTITIKFVRPGTIRVTQGGTDTDCGFGHNVTADGMYTRVSSKKPNFDRKQ